MRRTKFVAKFKSDGWSEARPKWATAWKTNKLICAPNEDSDQPGHPFSLIRVFTVHMMTPLVLSYPLSAHRRLWSDWVDAQSDLSLHWAHMPFRWFYHAVAQIDYLPFFTITCLRLVTELQVWLAFIDQVDMTAQCEIMGLITFVTYHDIAVLYTMT